MLMYANFYTYISLLIFHILRLYITELKIFLFQIFSGVYQLIICNNHIMKNFSMHTFFLLKKLENSKKSSSFTEFMINKLVGIYGMQFRQTLLRDGIRNSDALTIIWFIMYILSLIYHFYTDMSYAYRQNGKHNMLYNMKNKYIHAKNVKQWPMKLDIIENNEKMISSLLCRGQTFI